MRGLQPGGQQVQLADPDFTFMRRVIHGQGQGKSYLQLGTINLELLDRRRRRRTLSCKLDSRYVLRRGWGVGGLFVFWLVSWSNRIHGMRTCIHKLISHLHNIFTTHKHYTPTFLQEHEDKVEKAAKAKEKRAAL